MNLSSQKKIAARLLKCGESRVWFDPARHADIAEAITAEDVRGMIKNGLIAKRPEKGNSGYRRKKMIAQKKKGRRRGRGSRKGKRAGEEKRQWMARIRAIRKQLRSLKDGDRIDNQTFRHSYKMAKSGFFRSRAHVMIYLERNGLLKKKEESE